MPLINCKTELKLKWTKYYVLSPASVGKTNANPNNFIFSIKDTKLYVPAVTLSARVNQKAKLLSKGLKHHPTGMNIKQNMIIKSQQMNIDIFLNQTLLKSTDYLF